MTGYDPLPYHCPGCGALLLDYGDRVYRDHLPDCPRADPGAAPPLPGQSPEYDEDGARVWRVRDDAGLWQLCRELRPALVAHFEARRGLADLPTTDDEE